MKKLTFKVSSEKNSSVVSLIKEINQISCRIYLDLENNLVAVENVNDTMIDTVIELVDNYYTILCVDIDNTIETVAEDRIDSVVPEKIQEPEDSESEEKNSEKKPTFLEPQSEDDLIIRKIEFQNEYIEQLINKFLRTAYWAMFHKNVSEKDIGGFIYSCMSEISMKYSPEKSIEFSVGDIIDCNYGTHLSGEINGRHVHGIVCNILNDYMAYVVPITKATSSEIISRSYLEFTAPNDVVYSSDYYKGGTVLLDKGKYVRIERFNSVAGRTTPTFFKKVLVNLATTFDFTAFPCEADITDDKSISDNVPTVTIEENSENSSTSQKKCKTPIKKIGEEESALLEAIGTSLDKLDKSKPFKEQVESFMSEIGMPITAKLVAQSFMVACDIKKINYENVIFELHNLNPNIKEDVIKATLKETFKSWLEQYPILAEKCPKLSLMSVLRIFHKRFVRA